MKRHAVLAGLCWWHVMGGAVLSAAEQPRDVYARQEIGAIVSKGDLRPCVELLAVTGLRAVSSACDAEAVMESLPGAVRVVCVGDSITYGFNIAQRTRRSYPARLQALLGPAYQVENFGCSGATLMKKNKGSYWTWREFQAAQAFNPQIVVIMLGINFLIVGSQ